MRESSTNYGGTYRCSIWLEMDAGRGRGLHRYLQGVYDSPRLLRKALQTMRQMNPGRTYVTDDPNV
jgi:hypothetical protein